VVQGTALANLFNDGFLDLIAPYGDGTALAWFENPKHHGGDPLKDVWTAHVIEQNTGVVGGLSVAAGDFNLDGRTDIAMAPMYADGTLVWYETPADRYSGNWIKHPIGPASYIHQGSLQIRDIDGDGLTDIGFAEQEQSSTKRIGIFFNLGKAASWRLQVLASTGGHNPKTGIIGNDQHPSLLTANHGFFGAPNALELFRDLAGAVSPPPSQLSSDDFDGATLGAGWTAINPLGDSTFQVNAGHLNITVPAGAAHHPWLGGNLAPRILQPAANTDLTATVKFDSAFTAAYQMNGILVEQDAANYLRLEANYDGVSMHVFAGGLKGNYPTVLGNNVAGPPSGSVWLRVTRLGDNWSLDWSNDGVTFSSGASFVYPIVVTRIGVFAGNDTNVGPAPALTAKIDYFRVGSTSPANPRAMSDDFAGSSLQSAWTKENPTLDSTFQVNSNHLYISVPGIKPHDLWTGGNFSARVMQQAGDVDLTTAVKFDSVFTAQYQMNGILIQADAANYLRLEMYYDGASSHLFAAVLNNNSPRVICDIVVAAQRAGPSWLRVTRQGQVWALAWSSDGLTFQTGVQFNQPMKVSRIGVYAGNDSYYGPVPPFTAAINYFHITP
jgi:regulation of enolase protein 1 (concanavalin A-like superfamily)